MIVLRHAFGPCGVQVQLPDLVILDSFWIVAKKAKIVYRVAVVWIAIYLLMAVKDTIAPKWTWTNDMSIRQNVPIPNKLIPDVL